MALPKRKISKSRRGKRRGNIRITPTPTVKCPKCGALKLSHRACSDCGHYGKIEKKVEKKPKATSKKKTAKKKSK